MIDWPCRNAARRASCTITNRSGSGDTWIPANIRPSCMPEPPRSECSNHGVRVVKMPWAEPSSRFTALFEALAIEWLKAASQKAVAGLLQLSWTKFTASWSGR